MGKTLAIIILIFIFVICFILASFPFSPVSLVISTILSLIGLSIPFINIKATWWLYTLGGRVPLPEEHLWMLKNINHKNKAKMGYKEYIKKSSSIVIPFMLTVAYVFIYLKIDSILLSLLKLLCLISIFGIGLTFGAMMKKSLSKQP